MQRKLRGNIFYRKTLKRSGAHARCRCGCCGRRRCVETVLEEHAIPSSVLQSTKVNISASCSGPMLVSSIWFCTDIVLYIGLGFRASLLTSWLWMLVFLIRPWSGIRPKWMCGKWAHWCMHTIDDKYTKYWTNERSNTIRSKCVWEKEKNQVNYILGSCAESLPVGDVRIVGLDTLNLVSAYIHRNPCIMHMHFAREKMQAKTGS